MQQETGQPIWFWVAFSLGVLVLVMIFAKGLLGVRKPKRRHWLPIAALAVLTPASALTTPGKPMIPEATVSSPFDHYGWSSRHIPIDHYPPTGRGLRQPI